MDRLKPWLAALIAPSGVLALVALAAPHVPVPRIAAVLFGFACVCAETLIAAALAPPSKRAALAWIAIPIGALVIVAVAEIPELAAAAIVTSALLAAGTLLGAVVGAAIEKPGHLLVVAVISAAVDVFSVLHPSGPTAQLLEVEQAVSVLILPWPMLGSSEIQPLLGVGDITFSAIYLAAIRRNGLSVPRTIVALAIAFAVTLGIVLVLERGIPALPLLGLAVIVAHPEARRLPREDRLPALIGLGVLIAAVALAFALR